jgi:hypothetical protein
MELTLRFDLFKSIPANEETIHPISNCTALGLALTLKGSMSLPGRFTLPLFFLVLFLGAMILGPLIYFGVGVVWPVAFHRAMDRALMLCALAALGLFGSRIPWAQV